MTTITASSYSPIASQPLTPLTPGQVELLKQGGQFDITQKVSTVVQRHLGFQGKEVFRTHFTKQQITFTLKNGNVAESRTLVLQNSHWMLSQNSGAATPLDPALENEVNTLVTEILANIGQASQTNAPNPAPAADPAAAVDGAPANNAELADVRTRLAVLEAQLRSNPTLEESLRIQQEILREVARLREVSGRQPHANTSERDQLQRQVGELHRALDEKGRAFQAFVNDARDEFKRLQAGMKSEREKFLRQQTAFDEKDQSALALRQRVSDLEAAVSQKDVEQRRASEAFQAFKAENESIQRQLQAQCTRDVQAADERVVRLEQAVRDAAAVTNSGVTALREQTAQKAALEQQLIAVRSELDQLKQTNQRALAEASSQLETLRAEKAALEARLGASTDEAKLANAQLSQGIGALEKQIQAQQAQLASDERLNQAQTTLIATQEQQLKDLAARLKSTDKDARSTIASLQTQNRQLEDALAQLQETLEAAQSKNASELAKASAKLQEKTEALQLLQAEARDLRQLHEGATQALEEQTALMVREKEAQRKKDQVVLERTHQIESAAAEKVGKLEADVAQSQNALRAVERKARQMEAQLKEELASQVEAVEALQAEKQALQTHFDRERQKLIRGKDEALQVEKTAESRVKALEEELRAITQRLQEMLRTKQEAVAAATRAYQTASSETAAVELEVAALMASVQPRARIAADTHSLVETKQ